MHYLVKSEEQEDWKPQILQSPGRFVLEHMGGVDPAKGINGEGFKFVLRCLDTGKCWVKLSPRISNQETFPFSDTDPLVRKLVEYAPTRLLGAPTGRIRNISSPCRTTWRCSTWCSIGCRTSRRASASSSTIQRKYSDFRQSNKIPPRRSASPARPEDA